MQTQPCTFPASLSIVHTPLVLPLQGVVHVPLLAVLAAHAGGEADGW
jgi:hypothetical protein